MSNECGHHGPKTIEGLAQLLRQNFKNSSFGILEAIKHFRGTMRQQTESPICRNCRDMFLLAFEVIIKEEEEKCATQSK